MPRLSLRGLACLRTSECKQAGGSRSYCYELHVGFAGRKGMVLLLILSTKSTRALE